MSAYTIHLLHRWRLSRDVFVLRFERPSGFTFEPGQYIRFHRGERLRDYTLVSSTKNRWLEICVRQLPGGGLTQELIAAPLGQPFLIEGPQGYFRFQSEPGEAVFIATGTGIAPFVAFVRAGARGFTLLQGAPTAEALLFGEEMRRSAGTYLGCLSAPSDEVADATVGPAWQFQGRVTEALGSLPIRPYQFYLCGGTAMIRDTIRIIDARFQGAAVFTETFY